MTLSHRSGLRYTQAALLEVQRLGSIAPVLPRQTAADVTLGEYRLPKGTEMLLNFSYTSGEDQWRWQTQNPNGYAWWLRVARRYHCTPFSVRWKFQFIGSPNCWFMNLFCFCLFHDYIMSSLCVGNTFHTEGRFSHVYFCSFSEKKKKPKLFWFVAHLALLKCCQYELQLGIALKKRVPCCVELSFGVGYQYAMEIMIEVRSTSTWYVKGATHV